MRSSRWILSLSHDRGTTDTTYSYDHTQQTGKTEYDTSSQITSTTTYGYDLQGRMSEVAITTGGQTKNTTYTYDSTGYRVVVTTDEGSTEYLVDHQNHTGYSQTIREIHKDTNDTVTKTIDYTFGHDEISQTVAENNTTATHIFHHDGHGSVRVLTDLAAAVLEIYSFDAYGNALGFNPAVALTSILYSGETFDSNVNQQYLRARWYDAVTGRFNRLDPFFGNVDDPQSLHKYNYTHSDPVNGIDPSGLFEGLAGLISSISISSSTDSADASKSASALQTGYQFKRTVEVFQKAIQIFQKIQDGLETAYEIYDMLTFDPSDLLDIKNALIGLGLNTAVSSLPNKVLPAQLNLPKTVSKKINSLLSKFYKMEIFHNRIQEMAGEIGTGLVLHILGYELAPLSLNSVQGPDQVAHHKIANSWGIFEAKGGYAKLGSGYGGQMGPEWISMWLRKIIAQNQTTDYGRDLSKAFYSKNVMLAAVINLNMKDKNGELRFAFQKYNPTEGEGMKKWGVEWTG